VLFPVSPSSTFILPSRLRFKYVHVCVCACVHVCVCACVRVCVREKESVPISVLPHLYSLLAIMCVWVWVWVWVCACVCVYVYVYVYAYVYVCMRLC